MLADLLVRPRAESGERRKRIRSGPNARPVERGDGEGFVICECPGCSAAHHYPEERHVPALWWLETRDGALQVCGTCANRLTTPAQRKSLVPLDREEEERR